MLSGWGKRLRAARGDKTLDNWSAIAQISRSVWVDYEQERRSPTLETLSRIAELSGKSIHWIATGEPPPREPIDEKLLLTATTSAMKIVESQAKNGLTYTPLQVASFVVDIYGAMIKEILDGKQSSSQGGSLTDSQDDNRAGHRKARA